MDEPTATLTEREIEDLFERHPGPHATTASPSSTSRTGSTRSRASPTASPSCATARSSRRSRRTDIDEREIVRADGRPRHREPVSEGGRRARATCCCASRASRAAASCGLLVRGPQRARSSASPGIMGAGRTELARAVFGADPIDGGRIELDGEELTIRSPRDAIDAGIGYLTEDRKGEGLAMQLGVEPNITLASLPAAGPAGSTAGRSTRRPRSARTSSTSARPRCARPSRRSRAATSRRSWSRSGWRPTRACCSSTSPRAASTSAPRRSCSSCSARSPQDGRGIVLISSYLPELINMCDRVLVLRDGAHRGRAPARRVVGGADRRARDRG